jgi:hypothetical protein
MNGDSKRIQPRRPFLGVPLPAKNSVCKNLLRAFDAAADEAALAAAADLATQAAIDHTVTSDNGTSFSAVGDGEGSSDPYGPVG